MLQSDSLFSKVVGTTIPAHQGRANQHQSLRILTLSKRDDEIPLVPLLTADLAAEVVFSPFFTFSLLSASAFLRFLRLFAFSDASATFCKALSTFKTETA